MHPVLKRLVNKFGALRLGTLRLGGLGLGTLGLGLTAACQTTSATGDPVAAMLSSPPSAQTLETISNAVSEALGGQSVQLSPNILTTSSTLSLETKISRSLDQSRNAGMMNDRSRPRPDHFDLMSTGQKCYLVHRDTQAQYPLPGVKCAAFDG